MPLVRDKRGLGRGISAIVPDADRDAEVSDLMRRVTVLEEDLAIVTARSGTLTAEQMYLGARAFIARNTHSWQRIKDLARESAIANRRFSLKREIEDMRESSSGIKPNDDLYLFNNSLTTPLTRFLIEEVPEVEPCIARRPSKVDKFFNGVAEPPSWPPEGGV